MKTIEEKRSFNVSPEMIWNIISDLSRSDWVPGVESITLEDNVRTFKMKGMGRLVEKILKCDHDVMEAWTDPPLHSPELSDFLGA